MTHELLLYLQDLREGLPDVFTSLALFFSSPFVYLLIPLGLASVLYLCVDKHKAEWMMLNISGGAFIGHFLKDIICNPRPWIADDRVHPANGATKDASGYSTPSSHSTEATTGFGSLIAIAKRRWLTVILLMIIICVMFSRLFLGVHTLFDVILGALLAIAVMIVNWFLVKISYSNEHNYNAVSVLLILIFIATALMWYLTSGNTTYIMRYGGLMLGTIVGRHLEHILLNFKIEKVTIGKNIIRCVIGLVIVMSCFIIPYIILGSNLGSAAGGFLATVGLFLFTPALLRGLRLNN